MSDRWKIITIVRYLLEKFIDCANIKQRTTFASSRSRSLSETLVVICFFFSYGRFPIHCESTGHIPEHDWTISGVNVIARLAFLHSNHDVHLSYIGFILKVSEYGVHKCTELLFMRIT